MILGGGPHACCLYLNDHFKSEQITEFGIKIFEPGNLLRLIPNLLSLNPLYISILDTTATICTQNIWKYILYIFFHKITIKTKIYNQIKMIIKTPASYKQS